MMAMVQPPTARMHTRAAASTEPSPPMMKPYLRCGKAGEGGGSAQLRRADNTTVLADGWWAG